MLKRKSLFIIFFISITIMIVCNPFSTFAQDPKETNHIMSAPPLGPLGVEPTEGTINMLVLAIDFRDYPYTNYPKGASAIEELKSKFFGDGNKQGQAPYESLRNYYKRSSYGKLNLEGDVLGWYRAKNARQFYQNHTNAVGYSDGEELLIEEAINYYKGMGYNFAKYDNSGNGKIDTLFIKWTGPHTDWATFWWPHQTQFSDNQFIVDGKHIGKYVWSWYLYDQNSETEYYPVTDIHEMGHILGLPDYYDYSPNPYDPTSGGVGGLDMMDSNWGDHNSFSKLLFGWIKPKEVISSGQKEVTLRSYSSSGDTVMIMPGATAANLFSEYFLVEYRKPGDGNDPDSNTHTQGQPLLQGQESYPNDGLIIWHVNGQRGKDAGTFEYNNSDTPVKQLKLMEADALDDIHQGKGVEAMDYYVPDSGLTLSANTRPNSDSSFGNYTGVTVNNIIRNPDGTITANFAIISKDSNLYMPTSPGKLSIDPPYGKHGTADNKISLAYTPGEDLVNGNVIFKIPGEFKISSANIEISVGGVTRMLNSNEISPAINNTYYTVTIPGITISKDKCITLNLKNVNLSIPMGTYRFSCVADSDGSADKKSYSKGIDKEICSYRVIDNIDITDPIGGIETIDDTELISMILNGISLESDLFNELIAYFEEGNKLFNSGNFEDAIAKYIEALKINSNFHRADYNIAMSLAALQKYDQALGYLDKTSPTDTFAFKANFNKGIFLKNLGKLEESYDSFQHTLDTYPNYAGNILLQQSDILIKLEENNDALTSLNKLVAIDPSNANAYYLKGVVYNNLGNTDLAKTNIIKAIELGLNPKHLEKNKDLKDLSAITMNVNGLSLNVDVPPTIIQDRTMVPVRSIFEALGAKVDWNPQTQTVTCIKGDKTVVLRINSTKATVNGESKTLDSPAVIIDGRTFVPARFIAESLGAEVEWDANARIVRIK